MPLSSVTSVQQMVAVPTLIWAATLQSHSTLSFMSPPALLPKQLGGLSALLTTLID